MRVNRSLYLSSLLGSSGLDLKELSEWYGLYAGLGFVSWSLNNDFRAQVPGRSLGTGPGIKKTRRDGKEED